MLRWWTLVESLTLQLYVYIKIPFIPTHKHFCKPHTPSHTQDYTLDEKGFCELPQVSESACPMQFLEAAFICCKVR